MSISNHGIHILPREWAAEKWQQAFQQGSERLIVDLDGLAYGPIMPFVDVPSWKASRFAFWKSIHSDEESDEDLEACFGDSPEEEPEEPIDGSEQPPNLTPASEVEAIYLWTGTGVDDQLSLLFSIHLLLELKHADPHKLSLVHFERHPRLDGTVRALYTLTPEDLSAHPAPTVLAPAQLDACRAAWAAYTAPDPEALQNLAAMEYSAMPHLQSALRLILRRYPRRDTGLSHWDYTLLRNAAKHGPNATRVMGELMFELSEEGDSTGDIYLNHRMQQLADTLNPQPLIQLRSDTDGYRGTEVNLTDFGRAVLEGRASAYPTNPIDEWIGGVHLSSAEDRLWFHDGDTLQRHRTET